MRCAGIRRPDGLHLRHVRQRGTRPPRLPPDVTPIVVRARDGSDRRWLGREGERALGATAVIAGTDPSGVVRSGGPEQSRARTWCARLTTAGARPSGRMLVQADHRYDDPRGLPLRDARFRHRRRRATVPRPGLRRRVSPVPHRAVRACRPPDPGELRCPSGDAGSGRGLHRDARASALPLFLCRGGRVHVMVRPARVLPPERLVTPRSRPSALEHKLGPATRCPGLYLDGTHTRWSGGTVRTHHGASVAAEQTDAASGRAGRRVVAPEVGAC
jgi:hypothetical protein